MKAQSSCENGRDLDPHRVKAPTDDGLMTCRYLMGVRKRALIRSTLERHCQTSRRREDDTRPSRCESEFREKASFLAIASIVLPQGGQHSRRCDCYLGLIMQILRPLTCVNKPLERASMRTSRRSEGHKSDRMTTHYLVKKTRSQ